MILVAASTSHGKIEEYLVEEQPFLRNEKAVRFLPARGQRQPHQHCMIVLVLLHPPPNPLDNLPIESGQLKVDEDQPNAVPDIGNEHPLVVFKKLLQAVNCFVPDLVFDFAVQRLLTRIELAPIDRASRSSRLTKETFILRSLGKVNPG